MNPQYIDTKVYTSDIEIMRMYAELCGKTTDNLSELKLRENRVGISMWSDGKCFGLFAKGSSIDRNKGYKELSEEQVRDQFLQLKTEHSIK
ncbi:hypothetical protein B9J93_02665 [Vibrio sp. V17_P4S1T151]|nr:hypothetical protein B9J93_02665 [Vibrio sp. V17_P4S1T151]OXX64595.1 hypothetical protein B9J89_01490 [Vibrio sp. V15_P4S5T153]